jgi:hypothetical protein
MKNADIVAVLKEARKLIGEPPPLITPEEYNRAMRLLNGGRA